MQEGSFLGVEGGLEVVFFLGGEGAYLDKWQSCCKVSALAMAHYIGCCRRRRHRNECDSASPPHTWQNTHSTLTTPHLKLSLLRK